MAPSLSEHLESFYSKVLKRDIEKIFILSIAVFSCSFYTLSAFILSIFTHLHKRGDE